MSSTNVAANSSTAALSIKEKMEERKKKLHELHLKRNEARMLNHKEVIEEDKRNKLPANWEARKRKAEWIQENEKNKQDARERGENFDRIKLLNISAEEAASQERRKKKKNPDQGFSDYQQATLRQYNRLVKNIKPDLDDYSRQRDRLGEAFYGGPNTILQGLHKDTNQGIDRMVDDLEKQIERREKYSRRRTHNDDADIDYINDRNMKFNKKLERFYGQYTTEIKQNLERGTAV